MFISQDVQFKQGIDAIAYVEMNIFTPLVDSALYRFYADIYLNPDRGAY
jgi:hypothetical protein